MGFMAFVNEQTRLVENSQKSGFRTQYFGCGGLTSKEPQ
jgi:hypothetical protein